MRMLRWIQRVFNKIAYARAMRKLKSLCESTFVKGELPHGVDLSAYPARFKKGGVEIDPSKYGVFVSGRFRRPQRDSNFVLDADYCFEFEVPNGDYSKSLAVVAFNISGPKSIVVRQIQGSRGEEKQLRLFQWERMLLQIVVDWARRSGLKEVEVIQAQEQPYYNERRAQQFYIRYDVTARRSGFKFSPFRGRYVLKLSGGITQPVRVDKFTTAQA